jgi:glycosyltransferase involved in cell wall biosynthesis
MSGGARGGAGGNGAYLDTTILRFAKDLRGIHQVVFRFVEVLAGDARFAGTSFLAAEGTFEPYLEPLGVARERVVAIPAAPVLGGFERFHGLFSARHYRKLLPWPPRLVIHPELRTVANAVFPQAVCYHDLIELERPAAGRVKWDRRMYYLSKARLAARVRHKMANSESTRSAVLRRFPGIDPGSIRTVHLGVRPGLAPVEAARGEPSPPACLYVGSYEPRKNIPALIRAFATVAGDTGAVLHLAGHADAAVRDGLLRLARESGVASRIRWHGLVDDAELRALYASSHFLLFPSLKEGFGLPLAEAMAHGLVVFAFRNSCIPEVVADGGVLAEDGDFAAWGRALEELVRDSGRLAELRARARERARYFGAEAARQRLAAWLEHVYLASGVPLAEDA